MRLSDESFIGKERYRLHTRFYSNLYNRRTLRYKDSSLRLKLIAELGSRQSDVNVKLARIKIIDLNKIWHCLLFQHSIPKDLGSFLGRVVPDRSILTYFTVIVHLYFQIHPLIINLQPKVIDIIFTLC